MTCYRDGDGHALVLLHGGTGSANHWIRNIGALARISTVYALDLPGFGQSPSPPSHATTQDYIDNLVDAVGTLAEAEGPVDLAGFSFGGLCAAEIAARLPGLVVRVVLVAPGGFGPLPAGLGKMRPISRASPLSPESRGAAAYNLGRVMLHHPPDPDSEAVTLHIEDVLNTRFDSRRISLGVRLAGLLPDLPERLMMAWGEADSLIGPETLKERIHTCRLARPDVQIITFPQSGHWVIYERAEAFNVAIAAFLTGD